MSPSLAGEQAQEGERFGSAVGEVARRPLDSQRLVQQPAGPRAVALAPGDDAEVEEHEPGFDRIVRRPGVDEALGETRGGPVVVARVLATMPRIVSEKARPQRSAIVR